MEFDERTAFGQLRIRVFPEASNAWARFVVANRVDCPEDIWGAYDNNRLRQYDIVEGPTADGASLVSVIRKAERREMSISDVKADMCAPAKGSSWGTQISFHTSKALQTLKIKSILYMSGEEENS